MIARMSKYDLVLYAGQSSDFIEKLRGLGLVDITTTGWEPSDEDRQLLLSIDNHHKAVDAVADATRRGHAVLKRIQEILVRVVRFLVARSKRRVLRRKTLSLVDRVVQLGIRITHFPCINK